MEKHNVVRFSLIFLCYLGLAFSKDPTEIKIGGIFYKGDDDLINIFNTTDISINEDHMSPLVRELEYGDILAAGKHVCELANEGVYGIVDGTVGRTSAHIQAVSDSLEIPHIITNHNDLQSANWSALNLYPSAITYNKILSVLIRQKEWENFTILYVKGYSLANVNILLNMSSVLDPYTVTVREIHGENYRPVFAAAKKRGNVNFLVDCPTGKVTQVLRHAQEVGLMSNKHSYIFTSPDLHTQDLARFRHGGANITGFRLMNTKDDDDTVDDTMTVKVALVHDAVHVLAEAYKKLPVTPTSLSCGGMDTWRHGSSVINYIRTNTFKGLTRQLVFDSSGQRLNFTFDVMELNAVTLSNVATWHDDTLTNKREILQFAPAESEIMRNKTFKVLISLSPPFGYVKETVDGLSGNDRYEGFTIDIIDELSQKLGFSYIFEEESVTGEFKDGKLTGMVEKIFNKKADFGICDFTITHERQAFVDFTTPFMSVGISILYKKPSKQPPAMFSFMEVFSKQVWVNMMLSQMILAVVIIFVGRISHKEWHNPIPCVEQPESLDNQFSLANAFWLIIGSVMQQGSEIAPIAFAPRMITSVWWFFTMVMISSYTGTLVAFLTVESKTLPFKTAEDLAGQNYISYGAKKGGSTLQFFNQDKNEKYKSMFDKMTERGCRSCPITNTEGRLKVQKGGFAFFMESAAIEYETERNCDLMQVGDLLDTKNYGIGMIKDSPYRKVMSNVILQMKESGTIQKLKDKWWKERRGGGACSSDGDDGETQQLEMKNMIGAFVVLGVGCIIGIFISILDMLWGVYKRTIKYKTKFQYELALELRFALKFSGDTKPVRRRPAAVAAAGAGAGEGEEARDELQSLRTTPTPRTRPSSPSGTCSSRHSHCTHRSERSQSLAFARRRRYSPDI